jgi:hypothetical protein
MARIVTTSAAGALVMTAVVFAANLREIIEFHHPLTAIMTALEQLSMIRVATALAERLESKLIMLKMLAVSVIVFFMQGFQNYSRSLKAGMDPA